MKVASKLAILLSLGALAPFASAKTDEQAYLDSCRKDPGYPVPVTVVSPRVLPEYLGETVKVEFTVNATGMTSGFSVLSSPDNALSDCVLQAVKQWQFAPAQKNGVPVTMKVILPVRVVDTSAAGSAAN